MTDLCQRFQKKSWSIKVEHKSSVWEQTSYITQDLRATAQKTSAWEMWVFHFADVSLGADGRGKKIQPLKANVTPSFWHLRLCLQCLLESCHSTLINQHAS